MRRFTVLAAVVVAALAVVGAAQAGNPDGLGPWADYVVAHNQGCAFNPPDMTTCVPVPLTRSDPQAAVGPAESPAGPNQNIPVSHGVGEGNAVGWFGVRPVHDFL